MRYWWVNHKKTVKYEIEGSYLWSPKRKKNGRNPFYEFMREVAPGDFIFSFANTFIGAIGIAKSNAYESPKPSEFKNAGPYWDNIGWRVDVQFLKLKRKIKPSSHMDKLLPELSLKYSPLKENGYGNQNVYLTFVPPRMAEILSFLVGEEVLQLQAAFRRIGESNGLITREPPSVGLVQWEEHLIDAIKEDASLTSTEREILILARRGQGVFKKNVMKIEDRCRITGVDKIEHLRASHIKPWRDCKDGAERLMSSNGLLLTPTIDHLFDRGFISFEDSGKLLISPAAHSESLQRMGIETTRAVNVGGFTEEQKRFLTFHREEVFLEARVVR